MAILVRGDTHRVQEGTNCFVLVVSQFMVVCCDLINQPSRLVYMCTTSVVLFFLSILPKNKVVRGRRPRDSQPQDKVWQRLEPTCRFGDCNHVHEVSRGQRILRIT